MSYRRSWFERLLIRLGIKHITQPWERKDIPHWQRAAWIQAEPKSMKKVG